MIMFRFEQIYCRHLIVVCVPWPWNYLNGGLPSEIMHHSLFVSDFTVVTLANFLCLWNNSMTCSVDLRIFSLHLMVWVFAKSCRKHWLQLDLHQQAFTSENCLSLYCKQRWLKILIKPQKWETLQQTKTRFPLHVWFDRTIKASMNYWFHP